ncbi:tryptophan-rich sensory protein [Maribacter sp. ACAM166]|uniref:tryptophan-rich sensory protein n=1 Tax=Maribacter sp. ACAM166 TaxID=2508996 RepID=UPI0010FF4195|nr:tryptophan-rich sensory protein [Maribacter sp. ACAM166]TLP71887.1 tryptophan-rich sensory protein [Maribacter sp. ACAM166]
MKFNRRWQLMAYLEAALIALGFGVLVYFLLNSLLSGLLAFVVGLLVVALIKQPWKLNLNRTSLYIDAHVKEASFSTGLLLLPENTLSNLAKLQRCRVSNELKKRLGTITPPNKIRQAALVMFALIAVGFAVHKLELFSKVDSILGNTSTPEEIQFVATDTVTRQTIIPKIIEQAITVYYPTYTRQGTKTSIDPNVKAVTNSRIQWVLQFDHLVSQVSMERMGETIPLTKVENTYQIEVSLIESGFYNFTFTNEDGTVFTSDLFALEAIPDNHPEVEIFGLPQYSYFDASDAKKVELQSTISDDFGISDAYIIATVSKGSGESVKFREEKLKFHEQITKGQKKIKVTRSLDLNILKMEVGDELYFYIEAFDEKEPKHNVTRSETYFAVIKDTVTELFVVEGTLGVDQMPDYFRSQRQLIIDTEKLIKDKPTIPTKEFKFRSNELGFDQKALRLKYGQFMGDESEMEEVPSEIITEASGEEENHEDGEEDLLKGYSHDHDGDNEHNLVPAQKSEEAEDPLHDYLHNHDNPEESTLFEESLKTKLRKALSIMWDAELYLRLYEPEKSLPFQYDALKLIQEIKNSARIYVHRIGFDPPPIKEESRLTGSIKDVGNFRKNKSMEVVQPFKAMEDAVARLETLISGNSIFKEKDKVLFTAAGIELARLAIENPGEYLQLLQGLKGIENNTQRTISNYKFVQKGVLSALPQTKQLPGSKMGYADEINSLFLKQLETYD